MKNPLNIRQNFYQGQSVSASNLTQLQDYSDNARNLIVSDILGYGIVSGFHVAKDTTNNFILGVGRGLAYTEQGVRLESDTEKTINTKEFIESSQLPIDDEKITRYLTISLDYDKTKPVTDSFNNSVLTEWTPTVKATLHLDKTSHTINDLLIAEIIIGQKGVLTITKIVDKFSNSKNPNIIDMFYPIKSTYTQFPDKTTGLFREEDSPKSLFGGDWEKQFENESIFFRTQGSLANENRDTGGLQADAMQRLTGDFVINPSHFIKVSGSGIFQSYNLQAGGADGNLIPNQDQSSMIGFDNARQARTSETENRSRNRPVIIWKRIG